MATTYKLKPYAFNFNDLAFLQAQINFRPLFDADGNAIISWNGIGAIYDANGVPVWDGVTGGLSAADAIAQYGTSYDSYTASQGLRDPSGMNNNLFLVNAAWGSADQPFLQRTQVVFDQYVKPLSGAMQVDVNNAANYDSNGDLVANPTMVPVDPNAFYALKFTTPPAAGADYTKTATHTVQNVVDYTPRMISQLTTTAGATFGVDANNHITKDANGFTQVTNYGDLQTSGLLDTQTSFNEDGSPNNEYFIGATNPGVAPVNGWFVLFGQFFDHGLDFIGKGADGTKITINLAQDDPMYGVIDPSSGMAATKIVVSRANVSGFDAAGNPQWANHTSPYIDQSQTYGSSYEVTDLLREWVSHDGGTTYQAGSHLLDGHTSVQWKNAFGDLTTATLPTLNELRAHLIETGRDDITWEDVADLRARDANGHVVDTDAGTAGIQAQLSGQSLILDMNPRFDFNHFGNPLNPDAGATFTANIATLSAAAQALGAGYDFGFDGSTIFLTLPAGAMGPGSPGMTLTGASALAMWVNFADFSIKTVMQVGPGIDPTVTTAVHDAVSDLLLAAVGDHYIAGDGRVNENIGLTAVHHVWHEEHNFQIRNIQEAVTAEDVRQERLDQNGTYSHDLLHDWQLVTSAQDANGNYLNADGSIAWNDDKLFNAAKITVEMEYQHTAIDQFARTITPNLAEFVGYNTGAQADTSLDFSQVAYRFGHSTLRESIDTIDPNGDLTGAITRLALEKAFLNPELFSNTGAAAVALGMTHQQANEIDEYLTPALNQGLLGMPLDLAAINIARGRDVGIPTLNAFRAAIGLTEYTSWADFGNNMIHPDNLVNFIAAYSFDGNVDRAAAIIGLENGTILEGTAAAMGYTFDQALNFLQNTDAGLYGVDGFNHIDTWLGGLAEVHITGGLLGETFDTVFVDQMSRLMNGDRFYYLYRLDQLQMGEGIINEQFKDIVERNTGAEHLNGSVFAYADKYYDLSETAIGTTTEVPNAKTEHKYGEQLALHPDLGVYSTKGSSTAGNGSIVTVNGVQFIRDIRVEDGAATSGTQAINDGLNLDGTPNSGAESHEVIVATDRADLVYAWGGDDTVYAEGGNDTIYGGNGIDRIYGGDGNDRIYGGDGGDLLDGGAGDDWVSGEQSALAAAGVDQIIGGEGNDVLHSGIGIDKLSGESGDDFIFGEGDTDAFTHGGDGNDVIDGGAGGDLLWGDDGDDLIIGGDDQDISGGMNGDDIMRPGKFSQALGGGPDEVMGGDGKVDLGNDGKGRGFDLIDFSDQAAAPVGVTIDFATQANPAIAIDGTTPFPAWVGIEGAIGSRNNDTFIADPAATGFDANNWLIGGSGNDTMSGGLGNDVIIGDGIRLDSLIGTYASAYNNYFDGANMRAGNVTDGYFVQSNGLLDAVGGGFDKHFTSMLSSATFQNLELGGSTVTRLWRNGVAGTDLADSVTVGDGGTAGASDQVVFSGNRAEYIVTKIDFATQHQGVISAYKIEDTVAGRDGTDVVVGVEAFKFLDGTQDGVTVLNNAPVITSDGGGATAAVTVAENTTAVTTVVAVDPDAGQTLTYSLGGADAGLFSISATGVLSFVGAPNFEAPQDGGANNVYDVVVQVSDGQATDTQSLSVTVSNVDEASTGSLHIASYLNQGSSASVTAVNSIADPDGMTNFVQYQWQRLQGGTWVNIANATNATLGGVTNSTVRVSSSYTDPFGNYNFASPETALVAGSNTADVVVGTTGNDYVLGLLGADTLTGGAGSDTVDGGANNDTFMATVGDGNDAYLGGAGVDTYNLQNTTASAVVDLAAGTASSADTGADTLSSVENAVGGSGADVLTGNALANQLVGNGGNDTLDGGAGNDTMGGGFGDDTYYVAQTGDVVVEGTNAGIDRVFSSVSYTLSSGVENLTLTTTAGISGTGNGLDNVVTGNDGANLLSGVAGNDTLVGGGGNDTLSGGAGKDYLTGGAGNDMFDFDTPAQAGNGAAARDVITDFVHGQDHIDLSGIDANTAGLLGFLFNESFSTNVVAVAGPGAAFSANSQLHYYFDGVNTIIEGNVNGNNATAEFQIEVAGSHVFTAGDFIL